MTGFYKGTFTTKSHDFQTYLFSEKINDLSRDGDTRRVSETPCETQSYTLTYTRPYSHAKGHEQFSVTREES